ncbi:MAG: DUF1254 domain-containing protein [Spirochaetota bacterium]|nr:DUF1254 domain-containing protein [Spirochaetota bacterium]
MTLNKKNIQLLVVTFLITFVLAVISIIYFAPRLIMRGAQFKLTNSETVTSEGIAPLNSISHTHRFPTAEDRVIVRLNTDTFYSSGWFQLKDEPFVVHVPETDGRYYSLQFNDVWTNAFAYIGKRTTGSEEGSYIIVGPKWEGDLPDGVKVITSPSNLIWVIGRTMFLGADDVEKVIAIQEQITFTPLSTYSIK